jgi:hypothetical protein
MSTIKDQTEFSGMFGESLSLRKVNGRVVAKNRPQRKAGAPSQKQLDHQDRFDDAVNYASNQLKDPGAKEMYTAAITTKRQNAFALAVRDYLVAPKVSAIDAINYQGAIGDLIEVKAKDDFMVTKVTFQIQDASGAVIERGEATPKPEMNHLWIYKATVANPVLAGTRIKVTAYDRPGNSTSLEKVLL